MIALILLGALFGYAIAAAQRDRHVQTVRNITANKGKFGPFPRSPRR